MMRIGKKAEPDRPTNLNCKQARLASRVRACFIYNLAIFSTSTPSLVPDDNSADSVEAGHDAVCKYPIANWRIVGHWAGTQFWVCSDRDLFPSSQAPSSAGSGLGACARVVLRFANRVERVLCWQKDRVLISTIASRNTFPTIGLEPFAIHSVWGNSNVPMAGQRAWQTAGQSRRRSGRRAESDFDRCSLPPRRGDQWQVDWVCRWLGPQVLFAFA